MVHMYPFVSIKHNNQFDEDADLQDRSTSRTKKTREEKGERNLLLMVE